MVQFYDEFSQKCVEIKAKYGERITLKSTLTTTISHPSGLHARPASLFVQTANKYLCDIQVKNLTDNSDLANAKSILSVLTLGVCQDHEIEIIAEGEDADDALKALEALIEDNFGED